MSDFKGIKISKTNVKFRQRLMEEPGVENLTLCYQCGICTADCPVAMRVEEFRPRQIARLAAFGQKKRLIMSDLIWLCAGCYTCYERCPENVRVSEIVSALRRVALREGVIHPTYRALMENIAQTGYIYELGEFENEMREDDGLPSAPQPRVDEIEAIMRKTNFFQLLRGR